MTFISYAQNFEDVMLWRALKHVEKGFYIDVGANDPTLYSVTRAFYDAGWSGINLEPVAEFFGRLEEQRPRDINLRLGAGSTAGSFPFYDIPETGLATSDPDVAERHRQNGWEVIKIDVPVLPLAQICAEHAPRPIHFLKIDVEGAEKEVLLGMNFKQWRPWILVIEATAPMSQETMHDSWEPLVIEAGYEYVYFDGLNRYYVAQEHAELKQSFIVPPNVFDGYVLNADQESKLRATEADIRANQSRARATEAETKLAVASERADTATHQLESAEVREKHTAWLLEVKTAHTEQVESQLAAVYSSASWRITRPLRGFKLILRRPDAAIGVMRAAAGRFKTILKNASLRIARKLIALPVARKLAVKILVRFPALENRMRTVASRVQRNTAQSRHASTFGKHGDADQLALPLSARKVLGALQRQTNKSERDQNQRKSGTRH